MEAVFFDLGNTLVKERVSGEAARKRMLDELYRCLREEGECVNYEALKNALEKGFKECAERVKGSFKELNPEDVFKRCFESLGLTFDEELLRKALKAYFYSRVDTVELYDDALPTLKALKSKGLKLALISNALPDGRAVYEALGLSKYFDIAIFSFEVGLKKPHPLLFEQALNALGVKERESLMVGDSLEADILGARILGMEAALIVRNGIKVTLSVTPSYIISDLRQLLNLLT